MSILITGLSIAKGIALGKAFMMTHGQSNIPEYSIDDDIIDSEIERYTEAVKQTRDNLQSIGKKINNNVSVDIADFIAAHILTLDESAINREPRSIIRKQKINAEWALKKQSDELVKVFDEIDEPYLLSRKNDILQVINMILKTLSQQDIQPPESNDSDKRIIITQHLNPADLATWHGENIVGFVSEYDAPNSHTAIMARSLGIPIITGIHNVSQYVNDGDKVLIDGKYGALCIDPDQKSTEFYQDLQQKILIKKEQLLLIVNQPVITTDQQKIGLSININRGTDADNLANFNPDSVGLYRTESLYQNNEILPSEEVQFLAYKKLALQNIPITIRTLDLETNPYLPKTHQKNDSDGMLGLRAIRFSLTNLEIFTIQLRAILRASAFGKIHILLPMVTSLEEVLQTKAELLKIKAELKSENIVFDEMIEIGVMIETPAMALSLELFINHIDFFAIGTNDLVQYILAIDRSDELVNHLYTPYHPAVLTIIDKIIQTANNNDKRIYMCGEMASDTQYTRLLLGMGLQGFSVNPNQFLEIKQIIRQTNINDAKLYVNEILKSSKLKRIRELIESLNNG